MCDTHVTHVWCTTHATRMPHATHTTQYMHITHNTQSTCTQHMTQHMQHMWPTTHMAQITHTTNTACTHNTYNKHAHATHTLYSLFYKGGIGPTTNIITKRSQSKDLKLNDKSVLLPSESWLLLAVLKIRNRRTAILQFYIIIKAGPWSSHPIKLCHFHFK